MTDLTQIAEESARGSFFLLSGTAISTVILAVGSILIGRILGPELYGQYTLAFVIPQLLFIFTDLGINQGIIRFSASLGAKDDINRLTKMIKYGLMLKASLGIAIFILNYALADFLASALLQRPDLAFYMRIASVSIGFQTISTIAAAAFVGLDKTEYNALTSNIEAISKTIISVTLVLFGFSVAGAVLGSTAGYVISAVTGASLLFFLLRQSSRTEEKYSSKEDLKRLIFYAAPLYAALLLTGFVPVYQNIILAIFVSDAEIGNFRAAANFVVLITTVSIPLTTALLPAFSKFDSSSTEKIRTFFKLANKYTAMLVLPIIVLIIMFSSEIVQIIYGSTYQSAPLYLATYCLLFFQVGLGYLTLTSFYNGLGETKTTLKISLITFAMLALLSPILARALGVQGLIIAFLIASVTGTIFASYIARTNFKIEFETEALKKIYFVSLSSSVPALLLVRFLAIPQPFNVITGGLLYLFTYATLTPVTRIIDHPELEAITQTLQKIKPLSLAIQPLIRYQRKMLGEKKPTGL